MEKRWKILSITSVGLFMASLDLFIVNLALPSIARDFGNASLSNLSWVLNAYAIVFAALLVPAGRIADRIGRKRVFTTGFVLFTVSSIAAGMAGSIEVLDITRGIQGIGGALLFATSLSLLAEAFPRPEERVKALAAYGASIGAAFAFGPLLGGALTSAFGWEAVFFVNVPLGILGMIGTARYVRE